MKATRSVQIEVANKLMGIVHYSEPEKFVITCKDCNSLECDITIRDSHIQIVCRNCGSIERG